MGFAFTMAMTALTTIAMIGITKKWHSVWGTGDYNASIGAPIAIGLTAGTAFFFRGEVSLQLFKSMGVNYVVS